MLKNSIRKILFINISSIYKILGNKLLTILTSNITLSYLRISDIFDDERIFE